MFCDEAPHGGTWNIWRDWDKAWRWLHPRKNKFDLLDLMAHGLVLADQDLDEAHGKVIMRALDTGTSSIFLFTLYCWLLTLFFSQKQFRSRLPTPLESIFLFFFKFFLIDFRWRSALVAGWVCALVYWRFEALAGRPCCVRRVRWCSSHSRYFRHGDSNYCCNWDCELSFDEFQKSTIQKSTFEEGYTGQGHKGMVNQEDVLSERAQKAWD